MKKTTLERYFRKLRSDFDALDYRVHAMQQVVDYLMKTKRHIPFIEGEKAEAKRKLLEQKEAELRELLGS